MALSLAWILELPGALLIIPACGQVVQILKSDSLGLEISERECKNTIPFKITPPK